jgi:hypothetical protein
VQVLPIIRGAQLQGYLDGTSITPEKEVDVKIANKTMKESNPEYIRWTALQQQVLGFLMTSMTQEVMGQAAACDTPQEVWSLLEQTHTSQSRARTVNTRIALVTTRKDDMSISEYITKMKNLANEMASAKKRVDDKELAPYILAGLDEEYNPVVFALLARVEPVSIAEAHSQLLTFENRMNLMHGGHQASVNAARRGRGGPGPRGRGRSDRGHGGFGRGYGSQRGAPRSVRRPQNRRSDKVCQVCERTGHTTMDCWYRYDESYSSTNSKTAAAATHGYGVDTNWYTNTAATDRITSDLDKLTVLNKYKGSDQIVTASGVGMDICNIGHAVIKSPIKSLHLKNILHVPTAQKNLVSVHCLTSDNHASLEYFPHYFLVKDLEMSRVLLRGRCKDGLYPLPSSSHWRGALVTIKISPNRWHSRLGHPSLRLSRN